MLKMIKRLSILFSAVLMYFVLKEFILLFTFLADINIYLATAVLAALIGFLIYFGIIPLIKIILLPVNLGPTKIESEVSELRKKRIDQFVARGIKQLPESIDKSEDEYEKYISSLEVECEKIRKKYVTQVFYSTSISQNGFLDAIFIFSSSVNLVKEIFELYNGRVSNLELWIIAKKVYASIVIGGSEGIEYASEEIFSKFASDTLKSIPFLDKIIGSLADGFMNAALLTRVSLITENYCKMLYIEKEKDLYPSTTFIYTTAKTLTSEMMRTANTNLIELAKDKSGLLLRKVANPVGLILGKGVESVKEGSKSIFSKVLRRNKD